MRLIPFVIAALLYAFLALRVLRGPALDTRQRRVFLVLGGGALAAHLLGLFIDARAAGGVHLHFFAALSWVSAGMASVLLLALCFRPIERIGAVVFPIAAAACLLEGLAAAPAPINAALTRAVLQDWRIATHAVLALIAFATLAVAALVAVMLGIQDRALRAKSFAPWLQGAPPLTQVEGLMFQLIGAGFVLLSLALFSGVMFVQDLFAQHLVHKTILAIAAWLVFGTLLFGRWRYGWRGRRAIRLVLTGTILLVLAYLGSKFVLEMVLHRGA
jgi:ABC-type uncharacterized transport system permease subunit